MTPVLLMAGALLAPSAPSLPDGNVLVRELAQKQRRWEDILDSYTYDVEVVRDDLDRDDRVTKRERRRYEVFYVKGRRIRRLVEEDGRPLDVARQAKVDREVREKVDAINEQRVAQELPAVRLSEILARYDFRSVGREAIDGRPAIVLEFTALPGSRPLAHDDVLRNLAGRVWMDEAEREVVRAEVRNTAGMKFFLGLGASVSAVSGTFDFRKVGDTLWLPVRDETRAAGRMLLFKTFRTRVVHTYGNFRRFDVQSEEKLR
ncbi:MAG TPA: hypothetical protein VGN09_22005 [Vicinamibacteria bacterium]|jgi:hypothetical protein